MGNTHIAYVFAKKVLIMNPRILKKLCKRADKYIPQVKTGLTRVISERGEFIDTDASVDRKHLDRWHGKPSSSGFFYPKKGTISYGSVQGYFEREWEEKDAFSILRRCVIDSLVDWESYQGDGQPPKPKVKIKNPKMVFLYAKNLLLANSI